MNSRHSGGFFASSRLIQTCDRSGLQVPHFVFIRRTIQFGSSTSSSGAHLVDYRRNCALELVSIPLGEPSQSSISVSAGADVKCEAVIAAQLDATPSAILNNSEAVRPPPHVVGLAIDHLALALPGLILDLLALPAYPARRETTARRMASSSSDGRSGDANTSKRRVDADVEILDLLANDVDIEIGDADDRGASSHLGS